MHSRSASKRLKQTHAVSQSVVVEHHETSTNGSYSEIENEASISERLKLLRKSPKTDYTYSQYSKDRYEISPGVINMPNMSRLSYKRELNSPDYPDSVLRVRTKINKTLVYSPTQETTSVTTIHKDTKETSHFESIRSFVYTFCSVIFLSIISVIQKTSSFITYPLRRIFYNENSSSSSSTSSSILYQNLQQKTPLYTLKNKQYRDFRYFQEHSNYSSGISYREKISQGLFSFGSLIYKTIGRVVVADISTIVFIRQLFKATKNNLLKYLPYLLALLLLLLPLSTFYYLRDRDLKDIYPSNGIFSFWKSEESTPKIQEILHKTENLPCDSQLKSIIAHIETLQNSHESLKTDFNQYKSQINLFIEKIISQLKLTSDLKIDFELLRKELEANLSEKYKNIQNIELIINKYEVQSIILDDLRDQLNQLRVEMTRKDSYVTIASNQDEKLIRNMVESLLKKYDADKTGMADFALETSGGSVISAPCTETYNAHSAVWMWKGIFWWEVPPMQPNVIIQPGLIPGKCWAFRGTYAKVIIHMSQTINVTAVSLEHIPKDISLSGNIDSAPKDFTIYGMKSENDLNSTKLGSFTYEDKGISIQTFYLDKPSVPLNFIEIEFKTNHGNPIYTCIYRFRVHGNPVY